MRRLTAYIVCLFMTGVNIVPHPVYATDYFTPGGDSEAVLLEKYPHANIIHVTPEGYPALQEKLLNQGYLRRGAVPVHVSQLALQKGIQTTGTGSEETASDADCAGSGMESAGDESIRVMVDFTEDMMQSGNGSSSDEAAVVFVIVGTVVLVVWTLYVFKYVYDVSSGFRPCGSWKELSFVTGVTSTGNEQHVRFDGVRYSAGFRDGSMDVGISLELGKTDILLTEIGSLELKGGYWLLGPALRWRLTQDINPSFFQMNFAAGTTEHSEVGLMARASLGLLIGIGESWQLGLSWGALNINLDEDQGIISDRSQYHYLYGINAGFRF